VVLAESLLSGGNRVLALCPRESLLRDLRDRPGVVAVLTGPEPPAEQAVELLNDTPGPLAVLVDDATELYGTVVGDLLDQQVRESQAKGHVMVVAGVAEDLMKPLRGFIYRVRQARTGLLLCPEHTFDGRVIGTDLPRSAVFRRPVGRGVLAVDDRTTLIQVPRPTPPG
jgi:S-DNA-T family DNA segregation ATPase FtsK/SpoIIIE